MKVLVATTEDQGGQEGDYCWAVDGELVLPFATVECCEPDRCGCGRGFPGISSRRATTTATVVDRPELDDETYRQLITDSLVADWHLAGADLDEAVEEIVDVADVIAESFPVGVVLGRSGSQVFRRLAVTPPS